MPVTLTILDPTSLLGREITEQVAERFPDVDRRLLHTSGTAEHLIAEVGGEAALVPPLGEPDELEGSLAVVLTAQPVASLAAPLRRWLEAHPDVWLIDATQPGLAPDSSRVTSGAVRRAAPGNRWVHLADPSLAAPTRILRALAPLEPTDATLTVLAPASSFGAEALEELARQGAARLSGSPPARPEILPDVLAFDVVPARVEREHALEHQIAELFPDLPVTLQLLEVGIFHGHVSSLQVCCRRKAANERVRTLLRGVEGLRLARARERLSATGIVGEDDAACTEIKVHENRISLLVLADGLRLGGLTAAVDAIEAVIAS